MTPEQCRSASAELDRLVQERDDLAAFLQSQRGAPSPASNLQRLVWLNSEITATMQRLSGQLPTRDLMRTQRFW